jgi:dTDP-4-dehydrorhamnose reductase
VNCTGYNQVDRAEEEAEAALAVNAFAVRTLARAAARADAALVHFGSDFVFDGETDHAYTEEDRPEPQSIYAASKLLGEWFAAGVPRHYVLRVESLFGGVRGKSSLDRILDAIEAGGPVRVFVDRVVSPSYAWDVCDATAALLAGTAPPGVYHCVNTGWATWRDLAAEARRQLGSDARLDEVLVADVPLPARRPKYSALSNDKLRRAAHAMPTWQDALAREVRARARVRDEGRAR